MVEKSLAEPAKRRLRFEMERLADDVLIILVENHPKANRGVDTGAAFFHFRNFNGENDPVRAVGW
jgi:hypothetical protein